ncbi:MAG: hypothetical protein K0R93_610 [Anaerosolibacter sp.]|jgi:RNA binding exosome subunit|uniref:Spo0E family sporulation regulatory protein-aspartic acid phosphatase n=1 Tax=Anaerosolibacter sp. TaxID=1872527 RepID=UPI00262906E3|nr:Spo0E family sporulation regulatory protein-aspartic acid phosphatase [Anaerosolibacter sp.]MDF2545712.1 hypothetical protein [Anaerosolibacter sp.]
MKELKKPMEELREVLNRLVEEIDKHDNEKLLKVSQELDEVIRAYIKTECGK